MKKPSQLNSTPASQRAMTLIELLVVISIIGILAGLILPAVGIVKTKAKVTQAVKDMADIKGACNLYQHDYNRLPGSGNPVPPDTTLGAGVLGTGDFTYGTTGTGYGAGTTNILNNAGAGYQTSNAELMVILTASTFPGYTAHSSVAGNARNPRRTAYFNAKGSGGAAGAGLGTDGVMRDPFGNPYIVALDFNYDGWVSNSVYKANAMNSFNTGLVQQGGPNTWALKDSVMVFSFGPDGMFASTNAANSGVNRDNVITWK